MFHVSGFKFYILVAAIGILPLAADAQSLKFQSGKTAYQVGDAFTVDLVVDTGGQKINTIEGVVDVPLDKLEITGVRYGNSIVSLWVTRPEINFQKGLISFSGGVPGGFSGSQGPILSMAFRAKRVGTGKIFFQSTKVLLNDGLGTELTNLSLGDRTFIIKEAPPKPPPEKEEVKEEVKEVEIPPSDTVPPENFIPLVSRHPSVGDNKYFVSFFAVDKDTGISYYEIQEKPWILTSLTKQFDTEFIRVESPYILKRQVWPHTVLIRAYDQEGNYIDAEAEKPMHPMFVWILWAVAAAVAMVLFYMKRKRGRITHI